MLLPLWLNTKNPLWPNRVGYVDWKDVYNYALKDITDNGGKITLPDIEPSSDGTILEAEKAKPFNQWIISHVKGLPDRVISLPHYRHPKLSLCLNPRHRGYTRSGSDIFMMEGRPAKPAFQSMKNLQANHFLVGRFRSKLGKRQYPDNLWKGNQTISVGLPENLALDHIVIAGPLPEN